jgi:hypothetical protein
MHIIYLYYIYLFQIWVFITHFFFFYIYFISLLLHVEKKHVRVINVNPGELYYFSGCCNSSWLPLNMVKAPRTKA